VVIGLSEILTDNEHELTLQEAVISLNVQMIELNKRFEHIMAMGMPSYLVGQNGKVVRVNSNGELSITDGPYDKVVFNELDLINTAYNFFPPNGEEQFVLTGFLAFADKQVSSTTNATVIIYEASSPDSATVDKVLVQFELGQNQSIPFPSIRILASKGVYINAKTDDDDIHMTIFGHYVNLNGDQDHNFV
jgi:hypothetical protein